MLDNSINISVYKLAALPIDYLDRTGDPYESACAGKGLDPSCRPVISCGIRAYQLATYLQLVRKHYGPGVAGKVENYQQLLLPDGDARNGIMMAIHLVRGAIESQSVTADTGYGRIDIPIEMNVALALLLGMPGSPYFAAGPEQRAEQANSMGVDVDWSLSQCLQQAREGMEKIFSPLLACINPGVRADVVNTGLNEQYPSGKGGPH